MAYSSQKSVQILVALLKKHGIKRVVLSPGANNVAIVASLQNDPYFELHSCVDERSAAYIACGMAAETGEPVVLNCTGATASRNYVPGLTEAYYRGLPVLAVTASKHLGRMGQGFPQMLDRTSQMNDMVRKSVQVPAAHTTEDSWCAKIRINDALLELRRRGGGPAHINLVTEDTRDYDAESLPEIVPIKRYVLGDALPPLPKGRIAVFIGAHAPCDEELTSAIDAFCGTHNAVVLCDQTSNYRGAYRVLGNILSWQDQYKSPLMDIDLMVHIGAISGSYMKVRPKRVWRVDPRGDLQDTFRKLVSIFEMKEIDFFNSYAMPENNGQQNYLLEINGEIESVRAEIPDIPFSNVWCAQQMAPLLPEGSVLHLGILNSLRSWNLFETPNTISCYSNTGGFGIDGCVSTLLGASLIDAGKLYFGVVGDLAFFYDMNSIGNRELGRNIRLMIVNNGRGTEFRNYWHPANDFGAQADLYMAAAGHYGKQSPELVKHYATDLGFKYLSATSKAQFNQALEVFCDPQIGDKPIILEVFTDSELESKALWQMHNIKTSLSGSAKQVAKELLGSKGKKLAKKLMNR